MPNKTRQTLDYAAEELEGKRIKQIACGWMCRPVRFGWMLCQEWIWLRNRSNRLTKIGAGRFRNRLLSCFDSDLAGGICNVGGQIADAAAYGNHTTARYRPGGLSAGLRHHADRLPDDRTGLDVLQTKSCRVEV